MASDNRAKITLPKFDWKRATCPVCGETFDYLSARRPRTCQKGECRFKYHYSVDTEHWASHQPGLFDRKDADKE